MDPSGISTKSHWPQLNHNDPLMTHSHTCLAKVTPIWPQISLNNRWLSPTCLKGPQSNQFQRLKPSPQIKQPVMPYDHKSHLTSVCSSIMKPKHHVKTWRMSKWITNQRDKCVKANFLKLGKLTVSIIKVSKAEKSTQKKPSRCS